VGRLARCRPGGRSGQGHPACRTPSWARRPGTTCGPRSQITRPALVSARAVGVQRVHHLRADPRPRELQGLLRFQLQTTTVGGSDGAHLPLVPAHHRRRPGRSWAGGTACPRPGPRAARPGGRTPRTSGGAAAQERPPDIEYLAQVARSAEQLGFEAVLTPTGYLVRGRVAGHRPLTREDQPPEVPGRVSGPGLTSPTLAAQMAANLPAACPAAGCLLNVVTGGQARRASAVLRRLPVPTTSGTPGPRSSWPSSGARGPASRSTSHGEHYQVDGATVLRPPEAGAARVLRRLLRRGGPGGSLLRGPST